MNTALLGTIAAYGVLAVLLLSLNIFSLWRWWIKAGAIILTAVVFAASYITISGLIGWPSEGALPMRFSLLNTHIEEPDKLNDKPGHIYLWVQEISEQQIPIAAPRAFVLPYEVDLMRKTAESQQTLDAGSQVLGESKTQVQSTSSDPGAGDLTAESGETNLATGSAGTKTNSAGGIFGFPGGQSVNFSPMPPMNLPAKAQGPA